MAAAGIAFVKWGYLMPAQDVHSHKTRLEFRHRNAFPRTGAMRPPKNILKPRCNAEPGKSGGRKVFSPMRVAGIICLHQHKTIG
jgi:hypothetical protein